MRASSSPKPPRRRTTRRRTKHAAVVPTHTRHTADAKCGQIDESHKEAPRELRAHGPLGVRAHAARATPLARTAASDRLAAQMDDIPDSRRAHQSTVLPLDTRQSGSAHALADPSPGCEHELWRFTSDAVVTGRASGSDDQEHATNRLLDAPAASCSSRRSRSRHRARHVHHAPAVPRLPRCCSVTKRATRQQWSPHRHRPLRTQAAGSAAAANTRPNTNPGRRGMRDKTRDSPQAQRCARKVHPPVCLGRRLARWRAKPGRAGLCLAPEVIDRPGAQCPFHEGSAVWTPPAARAAASASTSPSTRAGASATLPERRRTRSERGDGDGSVQVFLERRFASRGRLLLGPGPLAGAREFGPGEHPTNGVAWGEPSGLLGARCAAGALAGEAECSGLCVDAGWVEVSGEALGSGGRSRRVPTGRAIGERRVVVLVGSADG